MGRQNKMNYLRINEDYLDDIEQDDIQLGTVEVTDEPHIAYQYQIDVPLDSWRGLWYKRLAVYLQACPMITDFSIRIAYGKEGPNDEAFFYGFEDKMEKDKELHDDYKCWRIRFNMNPGRPAKVLKYIREIVTLADNYLHVKNDFIFEVRDVKNDIYQPVNLKFMRAVMDDLYSDRFLNHYEKDRAFDQLYNILMLFEVDYQAILEYLMYKCGLCHPYFVNYMKKKDVPRNANILYAGSLLSRRLGYKEYIQHFGSFRFKKSLILSYNGKSQLKFAEAMLPELQQTKVSLIDNAENLLMTNEHLVNDFNENIVPINFDMRVIIKGRESTLIHMFVLGCPFAEGYHHVFMMAIEQPINGKRCITAAINKLSETYLALSGQGLSPDIIAKVSKILEEQF